MRLLISCGRDVRIHLNFFLVWGKKVFGLETKWLKITVGADLYLR